MDIFTLNNLKLSPLRFRVLRKGFGIMLLFLLCFHLSHAQYCIPSFLLGCDDGDGVNTFILNGEQNTNINDENTGCVGGGGYDDRTSQPAVKLFPGTTYPATIASEYSEDYYAIWIDFNDDEEFAASELVSYSAEEVYVETGSGSAVSIEIPTGAALGEHRMRVMVAYPYGFLEEIFADEFDPCNSEDDIFDGLMYGEVHDYIIEIISDEDCDDVPVAGLIEGLEVVCPDMPFTLEINGSTSGTGIEGQWQSSEDGSSWEDIDDENSTTYSSDGIDIGMYYRYVITCTANNLSDTTNEFEVEVTELGITSVVDGERCGIGAVELSAVGTPGAEMNWYESETSNAILETGSTFITPTLSSTTEYWVSENLGGGAAESYSLAQLTPERNYYTSTTGWGHNFTVTADCIIDSVTVYPVGTGTIQIQVLSTSNAILFSGPVTDVSGTGYTGNPVRVPVEISLPPGNYKLGQTATGITNLGAQELGSIPYPFTCPLLSITSGSQGTGTSTGVFYWFYDWKVSEGGQASGCESPRVQVTATVNPAPDLEINAAEIICNNAITALSVTTGLTDYDEFEWTPITDLYTDAAATIPYTSGTNASTVYLKTEVAGEHEYVLTAENTTSECVNIDTVKVLVQPDIEEILATPEMICSQGTAVLELIPEADYGSSSIQWYESADGVSYTAITGATEATYTTGNLLSETSFKVILSAGSEECAAIEKIVEVANPEITSSTDGERCGPGTVELSAVGTLGAEVNWYESPTSNTIMSTGSIFTTPNILTTTEYWVSSAFGGTGTQYLGPESPSIGNSSTWTSTAQWLNFEVFNNVIINSVDVFFSGNVGSSFTIVIRDAATNLEVFSYSGTVEITGLSNPQAVPINAALEPGTYQMNFDGTNPGVYRNSTGAVYPYQIADLIAITGNTFDVVYYYMFYNWNVGEEGCESPRQSVMATVNELPEIDLGDDDAIVCDGSPIILDAGNAGMDFLWNDNSANQTLTVVSAGVYEVTVTDNATGCSASASIEVGEGTNPLDPFDLVANLCVGDTIALDAGNLGSTYEWGNSETTQLIEVSEEGQYTVTITSTDGCSMDFSTEVVERELPIVDLGNDTTICMGETVILDAGNPSSDYSWNTGAGTQIIDASDSGTYSVVVTDQYNCFSSDEIKVSYFENPYVEGFNFIPTIHDGEGQQFDFSPLNPENVISYEWDFGDGSPVSPEENPSHVFLNTDVYSVTLKVTNDCGFYEVSLPVNVDLTGITVIAEDAVDIKLYPNPAKHVITVENKTKDLKIEKISIYSSLGSLVNESELQDDKQIISVGNLASGVYMAKIQTDKGIVVKRFEVIK